MGDDLRLKRLVNDLTNYSRETRQKAYEELGKLGDRRVIDSLIQRLTEEENYCARLAACEALGQLGEGQLGKAVIGADHNERIIHAQLECLVEKGDLRVIDQLVALLDHSYLDHTRVVRRTLNAIDTALKPHCDTVLCLACLTRFAREKLIAPWWKRPSHITVCRCCGKASHAMFGAREVVAIMDQEIADDFTCTDGVARVNWFGHNSLFDFDTVEIRNADDGEVERFCIAVQNDTDAFRRKRYPKMHCVIDVACRLSEHTLRILRRTFGHVER